MQHFLTLQEIRAGYGEHIVLENCTARLTRGAIHGIVGKNGQGKTTLLNVLRGRIKPLQGSCLLGSEALLPRDIAMLETEPFFYPRITGNEYLRLIQFANPAFAAKVWNDIFELPLDDEIETYSAGMRKKLAFMGVVGLNRPILLMDEPFNSLDLDTNYALTDMMKILAEQGTTLLVTSHILEPLLSMCKNILWLQGKHHTRIFAREEFGEIAGLMRSVEYETKLENVRKSLMQNI